MTDPLAPTSAHPVSSRVVPVVFVAIGLAVLIPAATLSLTAAALCFGVVVFFIILLLIGMKNAGAALCVLGMGFATMTSVVLPGAGFVTISDLLLVLGFAILLPGLLAKPLDPPWQLVVGALLFFVVGCLSSLGAVDTTLSFSVMIRIVVASVALPVMFLWWAPRGRTLVALAFAYPVGMVINVAYALFEGPLPGNNRYVGLAEQPTGFGFSALLALTVLPFLAAKFPKERRWMLALMVPVLLYGIWISGSRASVVVLVLLLAIYPLRERSIKAVGAVVLAGIVALTQLPRLVDSTGSNAVSRLIGGSGARTSNDARFDGVVVALEDFTDHPIVGQGFDQSFEAHDIYVQLLAMSGVLGTLAFLLVLWAYVAPFFSGPRPYRLLAYPALTYVLAGPITPNLGSRYITVLLAVALVVAGMTEADDEQPAEEEPDVVRA